MDLTVLSPEDIAVLKRIVSKIVGLPNTVNKPILDLEPEKYAAPDVYIAYTQDGLPRVEHPDDDGTGTGSGESQDYIQAGKGECDIYDIIPDGSLNYLRDIGKDEVVYNIGGNIPPDSWILVHRTKQGKWVAQIQFKSLIVKPVDEEGCQAECDGEFEIYYEEDGPGVSDGLVATGNTIFCYNPGAAIGNVRCRAWPVEFDYKGKARPPLECLLGTGTSSEFDDALVTHEVVPTQCN